MLKQHQNNNTNYDAEKCACAAEIAQSKSTTHCVKINLLLSQLWKQMCQWHYLLCSLHLTQW